MGISDIVFTQRHSVYLLTQLHIYAITSNNKVRHAHVMNQYCRNKINIQASVTSATTPVRHLAINLFLVYVWFAVDMHESVWQGLDFLAPTMFRGHLAPPANPTSHQFI